MLEITIPAGEMFDETTSEFIECPGKTIKLEHSLVSVSKWEAKHHKPFLKREEKSSEEVLDYIKCMTVTQNVDDKVYAFLSSENLKTIMSYIENPMTATKVPNVGGGPSRETVTSELIYYWMTAYNIPSEYQKWHLNRLMALIEICAFKNAPQKKMSKSQILSRNRSLNAARRAKYNTKG